MRFKLGLPLLVRNVAKLCNGVLMMCEDADCLQAITHISTDSRDVLPGDLFVALQTEKDDGHKYISDAIQNGASCILCHAHAYRCTSQCCFILCEDTRDAMCSAAEEYASLIPHKTIAVTGSVGKTTTRHYIARVLSQAYHVHESAHNYNNLLGTVITLLSMPRETEYLIAECGMDAPGQISKLSSLLKPDIAVITNIGVSHLASLGSKEAICQAKLEITDGMTNGILFYNTDDPLLQRHAPLRARKISCLSADAHYYFEQESEDSRGISFRFHTVEQAPVSMHIPTIGSHTLYAAAFSVAIASYIGLSGNIIQHALTAFEPMDMRQNILRHGNLTIVFDAYNASPDSMHAACNTMNVLLKDTGGKGVVVLGDMYELGDITSDAHRMIGAMFLRNDLRAFITWGMYADMYFQDRESQHKSTITRQFGKCASPSIIAEAVLSCAQANDVILIKGSRGMKMERLLSELKDAENRKGL